LNHLQDQVVKDPRVYKNEDKPFNDINSSLLQVMYRCTRKLCLWSSLQRVEHRDLFTGWRLQRGIFFPQMGSSVVCISKNLEPRRYCNFSLCVISPFCFFIRLFHD
jgi:hypothetical protein